VIDDPWRQQWPGGDYNVGFTRQWIAERDRAAAPGGESWVRRRIEEHDRVCEENQSLRLQNLDFEYFARSLEFYPPDAVDRRLGILVRDIEVPVFLAGAWQDEQTGSRFATMLNDFTSAAATRFLLYNGCHPDGYAPAVVTRWWEFLEIYVARRVPRLHPLVRLLAPVAFEEFFRVPGLRFEPDRFPGGRSYDDVVAAYESEPVARVLFEVGEGHAVAGAPVGRFEASFPAWPPPDAEPFVTYLGPGGVLLEQRPDEGQGGTDTYRHDPESGEVTYARTSSWNFIYPQIEYDWPPLEPGLGLAYLTSPLAEDLVVAGNGYANLWFASEATDANVQVTITEVRPDGTEFLVQSGLLRAGHRGIDEARSDAFLVEHTFLEEDFEPLQPGEFLEIQVPLRPFAHAFRAGSQIRLLISTPGRNSPLWAYENPDYGRDDVFHQVARTRAMPSFVLLPVVSGVRVPASYPRCPSLRGQICRPYVPLENEEAAR
jgi:uncharacterized protein